MKRIQLLAALLALTMLAAVLVSCGDGGAQTGDSPVTNAAEGGATEAEETEDPNAWDYPEVNFDGAEYRILNFDQLWDMYIHMDTAEQTGEVLNDAIYMRNRKVEDKLGIVINEKEIECNASNDTSLVTKAAKTSILAGDNEYDVMYVPISTDSSLVTEGYLMDLRGVDGLELDADWWDQDIIRTTTLNGHLYFASGCANLMAFDSSWCMFFNENMMEDLGLDKPYQLARDGKWTLDAAMTYAQAAASLNGDESFSYKVSGACVYGISCHQNAAEKFLQGAGEVSVGPDNSGNWVFRMDNERFYGVAEKTAALLDGANGSALFASNTDFDANAGGYAYVFSVGRSLFLTAEIKEAQLLRDMEDNFGIVPFPKYDETQDSYHTSIVQTLFFFTIPVTNTALDMTATVSEVLAHESYDSIIPLYYSNVVEQKGLRNEESIEMLDIMRATRGADIAAIFNWDSSLRSAYRTKLFKGDSDFASTLASTKTTVDAKIAEFMSFIEE